ncbi:MAG: DUF4870 domain-containing protein [Terriglobales bacterium]
MIENQEVAITQDERTMATLAHALQIVGMWIAPLIIFLVNRKSRFVSFHALQALILQIVYLILMIGFMVLWMVMIFAMIAQHGADKSSPPIGFFVLIPIVWLGFMCMWVAVLVIAIVYSIKAGRGEWANYPLIGRIARRLLDMDQGEVTASATVNR